MSGRPLTRCAVVSGAPHRRVLEWGVGAVGKYRLIERLGEGGMAEVWRAEARGAAGFRRQVALKTIRSSCAEDPHFVEMFVEEARLSARLDHPNIVATVDFGHAGGRWFLAMELVDGATLRACLRHLAASGRRLDGDLALHVAAELAAALDYAHSAVDDEGRPLRVIHRDVNPSNVLVSTHGAVKLSDFGIAKAAGRALQTEAGSLKGKIPYMSPEQAWGRALDGRSDVYALGLVLYELLTGRRALDGENEIDILERARRADVAPPGPEVAPEEAAILARALAAAPDERYATAGELRDAILPLLQRVGRVDPPSALGAIAREASSVAERDSPPPLVEEARTEASLHTEAGTDAGAIARPRRRWPIAAAAIAVACAGAIALAVRNRGNAADPVVVAHLSHLPDLGASAIAPPISPPPIAAAAPRPTSAPSPRASHRPPRAVSPSTNVAPPTSAPTSDERATLRIQVEPWGEVWLDDRALGMTPLRPVEVAAGAHTVTARHPALGERSTRVVLAAGEARLVRLAFDGAKP